VCSSPKRELGDYVGGRSEEAPGHGGRPTEDRDAAELERFAIVLAGLNAEHDRLMAQLACVGVRCDSVVAEMNDFKARRDRRLRRGECNSDETVVSYERLLDDLQTSRDRLSQSVAWLSQSEARMSSFI